MALPSAPQQPRQLHLAGSDEAVIPERFVIGAGGRGGLASLKELWRARELFGFFAWRDVKVRYKQTSAGILWAALQPLIIVGLFSLVFSNVKAVSSATSVPYPVYIQSGMLAWLLFAQSLSFSSTSLVKEASMLTKIYFPRLIVPVSSVIAGVIDFAIGLTVLVIVAVLAGVTPSWRLVFLPFLLTFVLLAACGVGIWLSALNVRFRDIQYGLPLLTQVWFFITPVVYPLAVLPSAARPAVAILNPMVGAVEAFRWSIIGGAAPPLYHLISALTLVAALLAGGIVFFSSIQRTFADSI